MISLMVLVIRMAVMSLFLSVIRMAVMSLLLSVIRMVSLLMLFVFRLWLLDLFDDLGVRLEENKSSLSLSDN